MRKPGAILPFASLLAAAALLPPLLRAEGGLTGAPILNRPVGARSSGMGRAFTAVPGGPESLMYNPAGAAFTARKAAVISYMNGFGGGAYGFAGVSMKAPAFVLTPAFLYYNSGTMNLNLSDGTRGEVTAESDKVIMLSAALKPRPRLALGGTVKFTNIRLAETASASAKHIDLGALYRATDRLSLAAASLNNGDSIKFEDSGSPAPSTLRAGAAYRFKLEPPNLLDRAAEVTYSDVMLAADWSRTAKEDSSLQAGFEMNMELSGTVFLALRAGYLFDRDAEGITFGFGLKRGRWSFDFGYESSRSLDPRYPMTLSCEF